MRYGVGVLQGLELRLELELWLGFGLGFGLELVFALGFRVIHDTAPPWPLPAELVGGGG